MVSHQRVNVSLMSTFKLMTIKIILFLNLYNLQIINVLQSSEAENILYQHIELKFSSYSNDSVLLLLYMYCVCVCIKTTAFLHFSYRSIEVHYEMLCSI